MVTSNDSFVRVSFVRFVYRSFATCIMRSFVCVFHIVRSFHFVRSCIMRSFRVSCLRFVSFILRFSYRSCEAFVHFSFVSFAFSVRLRLVRIVNLYDPGCVVTIVTIISLTPVQLEKIISIVLYISKSAHMTWFKKVWCMIINITLKWHKQLREKTT
jgi:hypothetical protein